MRHRKHNHLLGVKSAHRRALLANLCVALIQNGRIRTTLAKAKAMRPEVEKLITLAKKARQTDDVAKKVHYRRRCVACLRDKKIAKLLFDEKVEEFLERAGGYVRIYKLAIPRRGDAADMAIIELIDATDEGYGKKGRKKRKALEKKTAKVAPAEEKAEAKETPVVKEDEKATEEKLDEPVAEEPAETEEETPATKEDGTEEKPEPEETSEMEDVEVVAEEPEEPASGETDAEDVPGEISTTEEEAPVDDEEDVSGEAEEEEEDKKED